MEFPSALLGVALGTILLPSLARHYHDENHGQYRELLDWGLRMTFLLALPAALALALLGAPLVATLYQYGRFTVNDVWQTRVALLGYSVGLLGIITVKILAPGFYARQDMRTPVRTAFLSLIVAQSLAVALMFEIGHAGLTLATSIGASLNALLLYRALRRGDIYVPAPGWGRFFARIAAALVVLGAVLWFASGPDELWVHLGFTAKVTRLALVIAGGAFAYFAALWLLGFRLKDFNRREPS
jgi:putative peptidoglycan lipid II flippase